MWLYVFLPAVVAVLGGFWTVIFAPGDKTVGAVQHFAAGVVFYAAAGELLPFVIQDGGEWSAALGGGAGVAAMLLLGRVTERTQGPAGLVALSLLDGVIDGLVLGLGFNAGQHQGTLLAIALAIEFLFLGLSIGGAFGTGASRGKVLVVTAAVGLAVVPGVLIAQPIALLSLHWQAAAFAFGLIALLYLVTEELLVEAHEKPKTTWGTAMFFIGFLVLLVVSQAMEG